MASILLPVTISFLLISLSASQKNLESDILAIETCTLNDYPLIIALTKTHLVSLDQNLAVKDLRKFDSNSSFFLKCLPSLAKIIVCVPQCYSFEIDNGGQFGISEQINKVLSDNVLISETGSNRILLAEASKEKQSNIKKIDIFKNDSHTAIHQDRDLVKEENFVPISNIYSFTNGDYSYFIRNAFRWNHIKPGENSRKEAEWVIRLTRICNSDNTKSLRSWTDLSLDCSGSYKETFLASAAFFDEKSQRLLVYAQMGAQNLPKGAKPNTYVHRIQAFSLNEINEKIEKMWNICQNTTYQLTRTCDHKTKERPEHCYYYMHPFQSSEPCYKYGVENLKYELCHLNQDSTNFHLESFLPITGTFLGQINFQNEVSPAVAIWPSDNDEKTFFIVYPDRIIRRIFNRKNFNGYKDSLWEKRLTDISAKQTQILYRQDLSQQTQTVNQARQSIFLAQESYIWQASVTCAGLYADNCTSVKGKFDKEPLKCGWCVGQNATQEQNCKGIFLKNSCPPVFEGVAAEKENDTLTLLIHGGNLRILTDVQIYLCDNIQCEIIQPHTDERLQCTVPTSPDQIALDCLVKVSGKLENQPFSTQLSFDPNSLPAVTSPSAITGRSTPVVIAILVIVCLLIFSLILLIVWLKRNSSTKRSVDGNSSILPLPVDNTNGYLRPRPDSHRYDSQPRGQTIALDTVAYEDMAFLVPEKVKIDLDALRLDTQIGQGHFGIVYKATYTTRNEKQIAVAVKTLHAGMRGVREFLQEGLMMENFNHPRVTPLIGISFTDSHYPMLITEFMSRGDLLKYLRNASNTPTLRQLLNFGVQIAEGMQYLHKLKFIHRDLAARNCMLDDSLGIKIADFGLCRDVYESGNYEPRHRDRDLPLRWMAPEGIELLEYSSRGDVWSYGIVLWELMTRGSQPYQGIAGYNLLSFLKSGRRLNQPEYCPEELYDIMMQCWRMSSDQRPTFGDLCLSVPSVILELEKNTKRSSALNSHYEPVSVMSQV